MTCLGLETKHVEHRRSRRVPHRADGGCATSPPLGDDKRDCTVAAVLSPQRPMADGHRELGMLADMDRRTADAVEWLLGCEEPEIRHLARRDLLRDSSDEDRARIVAGKAVTALLSGQEKDGGFGGDPYRKWTGAHWRLVALADLDAPADVARHRRADPPAMDEDRAPVVLALRRAVRPHGPRCHGPRHRPPGRGRARPPRGATPTRWPLAAAGTVVAAADRPGEPERRGLGSAHRPSPMLTLTALRVLSRSSRWS